MMPTEKRPGYGGQTGYERLLQGEGIYNQEQSSLDLQGRDDSTLSSPALNGFQWYCSRTLPFLSKILVLVLAAWGSVSIVLSVLASLHSHHSISCNCGNSIAEAIAQGCKYDAMSTAWLPAACRDDDLSYEFDHAGPGPNGEWGYYADRDGNVSLTLEDVSMRAEDDDGQGIWVTQEWHIAHCTYYWRKVSRARMFGKSVIEKAYAGEGHAKHCTQIFFSYRPLQEINTRINAGLNSDLAGDSA